MDKEYAPEGGRRLLPLPIFAAVFFIVLAVGTRQIATSSPEPGTGLQPTVGQLWAEANAGLLDTEEEYWAKDVVVSLEVDQNDVTMTFRSLPGHPFTLEDFIWAATFFDLKAGTEVAALVEHEDGNWTVGYVLPASYMF